MPLLNDVVRLSSTEKLYEQATGPGLWAMNTCCSQTPMSPATATTVVNCPSTLHASSSPPGPPVPAADKSCWPAASFANDRVRDFTPRLGAKIYNAEVSAISSGAELATSEPSHNVWLAPRRHDSWRRDMLPQRHDLWHRLPGSKHAKRFLKGLFVKKKIQKGLKTKKSGMQIDDSGQKTSIRYPKLLSVNNS